MPMMLLSLWQSSPSSSKFLHFSPLMLFFCLLLAVPTRLLPASQLYDSRRYCYSHSSLRSPVVCSMQSRLSKGTIMKEGFYHEYYCQYHRRHHHYYHHCHYHYRKQRQGGLRSFAHRKTHRHTHTDIYIYIHTHTRHRSKETHAVQQRSRKARVSMTLCVLP